MKFDKNHKMQSVFNFVHVYVLFKAIQVKVLFLILSMIFLADFFLFVITKIRKVVWYINMLKNMPYLNPFKPDLNKPKI